MMPRHLEPPGLWDDNPAPARRHLLTQADRATGLEGIRRARQAIEAAPPPQETPADG